VSIKVTDMNLEQNIMLVDIMDNLLDSEPVNETICKIRFKLKYYILTLTLTHTPTEEKMK
jgi:hypothetical protein